ncbi:MAG: DUF2304 domain-containing protein [Proteobacteria bacterium]|nr:DUF2304 domain-containing protein [Pseudomonadota bacterium]
MDRLLLISVGINAVVLFSVVELIRRNRLSERYALLWLLATAVMLVFSFSRGLLHTVAGWVGVYYPPSLIFFLAFFFLVIINIHFSTVISRLSKQNKILAREVALIREKLDVREDDSRPG